MKYYLLLILFFPMMLAAQDAPKLKGKWQVRGSVTDLETKAPYATHANSYWWSDAAVNHSGIQLARKQTLKYTYMNEPKTATYRVEGDQLVVSFVSDEKKIATWTYRIAATPTGFALTYADHAYKHEINFSK